jgi:hypothetical protein
MGWLHIKGVVDYFFEHFKPHDQTIIRLIYFNFILELIENFIRNLDILHIDTPPSCLMDSNVNPK